MSGIDSGILVLIALALLGLVPVLLTGRHGSRYTEGDRLAEKQAAREAVRGTR